MIVSKPAGDKVSLALPLQIAASMKTIDLDQLSSVTGGASRLAWSANNQALLHATREVLHGLDYATRGAALQQQNQLTTMMLAMLAARR